MSDDINEQLVLIGGESGTGKSRSLKNIKDQKDWLYLNCEAGKHLPFKNTFDAHNITDPYQVFEAFEYATDTNKKGIIIDSTTFLMDMFESVHVITAVNTQSAWGAYQQFFKNLMQDKVVKFPGSVIMTAHIASTLDEIRHEMVTKVPVKGALKGNGVEAYFSTVVFAKKIPLTELEKYKSDLITITDREKELGYKHVFQTMPTKATVGDRIRSPEDLFTRDQTYMDNDAQLLLDHLHKFYN